MELVIVMLIISLLAAAGLPSYQRYTARGNRAAAKAFLTDLTQRQESFYSDRKRYARTLTDLGYVDTSGSTTNGGTLGTAVSIDEKGNLYTNATAGKSLYRVSLVANITGTGTNVRTCSGLINSGAPVAGITGYSTSWAAIAAPESPQDQRDVTCSTLCVNSSGRQGASGSDGWQTCWRG